MSQEKTGKFIAKLRKDKKMTQEQLAEKMGVSINAVSKWERGLCFPDVSLYKKLCNELGISIEELINGEYDNSEEAKERAIISTINEKNMTKKKLIKIIVLVIIIFLAIDICLVFYNEKLKINLVNDSNELYDMAINYFKNEEFKTNKDSNQPDFNALYSYHGFGIEKKDDYKYVYMWLYMQSYYIEGKDSVAISSINSIPYKVTFKNDEVIKVEYPENEWPKNEKKYLSSVRKIFPSVIANQVLDFDNDQNISKLYNEVITKKNKYYDYLSLDMGSLELEDISYGDFIFSVNIGNVLCVPVQLNVYKDNKYILYNKYKACPPNVACLSYLKYTKFIEGTYNYDILQILKHSVDANNMQFSNNTLPKYEIRSGNGYPFITDNDNKYLKEFLNSINIDLEQCASPDYAN